MRRAGLIAWVRGLPAKQADVVSEVTGPPKSVAYDAVGAPTRAAMSFAEKQGVHVHELYFLQTPKGEYLAAKQVKRGQDRGTHSEPIFCLVQSTTCTGREP